MQQLETSADAVEQYSRRPNLRFQGIPETTGENTDAKILKLINEQMQIQPLITQDDIERSHRLGPTTDRNNRPRTRQVIVRFRSERKRDSVFKARFKLKEFNATHSPDRRIFINEDLTAYRAQIAAAARLLKKERKINDTWTASGNIMVKTLQNVISQLKVKEDIQKY